MNSGRMPGRGPSGVSRPPSPPALLQDPPWTALSAASAGDQVPMGALTGEQWPPPSHPSSPGGSGHSERGPAQLGLSPPPSGKCSQGLEGGPGKPANPQGKASCLPGDQGLSRLCVFFFVFVFPHKLSSGVTGQLAHSPLSRIT